jgi:outer membrane immunogenic protein
MVAPQAANAQVALRGVRADAQVGIDRFYSEGNHHNKIGYGGSAGVDTIIGDSFVLGAEGTFWWSKNENITRDGPGTAARKSFQEWGAAIRAGVMTTPSTLIYGKAGLVVNEQRKRFNADAVVTPGFPASTGGNGLFGDYYNHYRTRGWVLGGGVEQMLGDNLYVKAEGRYSNYRTNSSRLVGVIGLGVLFGPRAEAPLPPPPPPPPPAPAAPATQTCPDGSVILATDTCPVPPPPPPPPPPAPERG